MALSTAALWILGTMAAAGVAQTGYSISAGQSAKKRATGQLELAERRRGEELKKGEAAIKKSEALAKQAETTKERAKTSAIAAGKRRRATIATGPRGIFGEPDVTKPTLLGG